MKNVRKILYAFILSVFICSALFCSTTSATVANEPSQAAVSGKTREKEIDALNLLFNYLFNDEDMERMIRVDFIDNDEFLGYEYQFSLDADPLRIEYMGMSKDSDYYLFWLNEQVHHDGEFSHATTLDFFAVDIEKKEIIAERDGATPDDWNKEFPW